MANFSFLKHGAGRDGKHGESDTAMHAPVTWQALSRQDSEEAKSETDRERMAHCSRQIGINAHKENLYYTLINYLTCRERETELAGQKVPDGAEIRG